MAGAPCEGRGARRTQRGPRMTQQAATRQLLIPVDGRNAVAMKSAVDDAIALYAHEPVAIHLLNVQPLLSCHVGMFFERGEISDIQNQAGLEDLAPARALL